MEVEIHNYIYNIQQILFISIIKINVVIFQNHGLIGF
jgi:hypothetical protein